MQNEKQTLKEFYEYCLSTCSEGRLKKIKNIISQSKKIMGKDLTKLKVNDIVKFLSHINQSHFTEWTKNDYKKIFKRFLRWNYKDLEMIEGVKVKEGFKGTSKMRAFNKEKINKNTLVKPEELEILLRTAKSLKWKALISLMYESGFRPCEIRNLKWGDLKFDDSKNICRVWTLSPKTKKDRAIPVRDCILHLKRWREEFQFINRTEKDYVFPSQHNRNKSLGNGVIGQILRRLCEEAKIRHLFPYMFRHSRIYEIQKKLPEKIASKFAGHSVETSEIYNHLADDDVEESMLQKIYTTEELTEEEENKLKKEVEKLKTQISEVKAISNKEIKAIKKIIYLQMKKELEKIGVNRNPEEIKIIKLK